MLPSQPTANRDRLTVSMRTAIFQAPEVFVEICKYHIETHGAFPSFDRFKFRPVLLCGLIGFEVSYRNNHPDGMAGTFQACDSPWGTDDPWFHEIVMQRGLDRNVRLFVLWHEIAHGLDLTEFRSAAGGGLRCVAKDRRHSSILEPLLKRNVTILGSRSFGFNPAADWSDSGLPILLGLHRTSLMERAEEYRSAHTAEQIAYQDDPEELFAQALALAVLNPMASHVLDAELHDRLTEILHMELANYFPEKLVLTVTGAMRSARADWRRKRETLCYLMPAA